MASNPSVAAFQRTLEERYGAFAKALQNALFAFASDLNIQSRLEKINRLCASLHELHDHLADADRPEWLAQINGSANHFEKERSADRANHLLMSIVKRYPSIRPIDISGDSATAIDFDELYERFRDDGRLPELFDELMDIVVRIIDSNAVDSLTALDTLKQILDLLKANRDGSYLAAKESISVARYLKHLADVVLDKIPVLSELRGAWDRTIQEAVLWLSGRYCQTSPLRSRSQGLSIQTSAGRAPVSRCSRTMSATMVGNLGSVASTTASDTGRTGDVSRAALRP